LHVHPLVAAQREAIEVFVRIWRLLALQSDDQIDGNDRVSPYTSPPYGRYFQAGHQDQENEEPR
jgi:hypothetical protein